MFVKICGITRLVDARHAVAQGADALGFIFWNGSPRYITPDAARVIVSTLPPHVAAVGVFVNGSVDDVRRVAEESGIGTVQLHGEEPPSHAAALGYPVWRGATLGQVEELCSVWPPDTTWLLDAADPVRRGGTGRTIDWPRAAELAARHRVILAGGLTPENVHDAIAVVRPFGVDVSSGVEDAPGVKNADKVTRFLTGARSAFGSQQV